MPLDLQNLFVIQNDTGTKAIVFVIAMYPDRLPRVDAALALKNQSGEWVPTDRRISLALGDIDPEFYCFDDIKVTPLYSESESEEKEKTEEKIIEYPFINKSFEISHDSNGISHLVGVKIDGKDVEFTNNSGEIETNPYRPSIESSDGGISNPQDGDIPGNIISFVVPGDSSKFTDNIASPPKQEG